MRQKHVVGFGLALAFALGYVLRAPRCDGAASLSASSHGAFIEALGALTLHDVDGTEFYERSVSVPGDPAPVGTAMTRARASGHITIAIVGGSTSAGGGHSSCGISRKLNAACGLRCCGESYYAQLVGWLKSELGVRATVLNRAVGATGPELAATCVGDMFTASELAATDLLLIEYAINTGGDVACLRRVDRLLWRVRALAPHAAIVFVHSYSLHRFVDGSEGCLDLIATHYQLPAISWKRALFPLLASGALAREDVFEPPIWHHPNARGHTQLGSLLAHFLLAAEARHRRQQGGQEGQSNASVVPQAHSLQPVVREPAVRVPALGELSEAVHARLQSSPLPSCLSAGTAAMEAVLLSSAGWRADRARRIYATAQPDALLSMRVFCARDGCGVRVGLTRSYQPLGILDILIDGSVRATFSEASPSWQARNRRETVNHFVTVVKAAPPTMSMAVNTTGARADQGGEESGRHRMLRADAGQKAGARGAPAASGALRAGEHTVGFRCRGETEPAARSFPSNYRKHEVQVRSVVVFYERDDDD